MVLTRRHVGHEASHVWEELTLRFFAELLIVRWLRSTRGFLYEEGLDMLTHTRETIAGRVVQVISENLRIPLKEVDLRKNITDQRSRGRLCGPSDVDLTLMCNGFESLIEQLTRQAKGTVRITDANQILTGEGWIDYVCQQVGVV